MTDESKTKEQLIRELGDVRGRLERLEKQRGAAGQTDIDDASSRFAQFASMINRGPAVVFRWRVSEDWPVELVSENVSQFGYTSRAMCRMRPTPRT